MCLPSGTICAHTNIHCQTHTWAHACPYTHTHTHTHAYTHIHTHMYTHTHWQTNMETNIYTLLHNHNRDNKTHINQTTVWVPLHSQRSSLNYSNNETIQIHISGKITLDWVTTHLFCPAPSLACSPSSEEGRNLCCLRRWPWTTLHLASHSPTPF